MPPRCATLTSISSTTSLAMACGWANVWAMLFMGLAGSARTKRRRLYRGHSRKWQAERPSSARHQPVRLYTHPFPVSLSHHSPVVFSASTSSMSLTISLRCSTLRTFVLNLPSLAHSGRLRTAGEQSTANCVSLPAESIMNESMVGKT